MKNILFLHFYLALCLPTYVYAQGNFQVKIYLNEDIDIDKINIYVDNGKTEYSSPKVLSGNMIYINGPYYGEYAQITVRYPKEVSSNFLLISTFFVKDKMAEIKFIRTDSMAAILDHYSLINVTDFKEEKEKMAQYNSTELNNINLFVDKYGSEIFNDTILTKKFFDLESAVYDKDLKYILDNKNSYYTFSFFRRNFVKIQKISSDSILSILNSFPDRFKNSHEGNVIRELVNGRLVVKKEGQAPDFQAQDILGKMISLKNFRKKDYVLLNFWATWCGPCIEEMPVLKQINDEYTSKGLTVISVAYPSTYKDFEKDVREYKMDWINIYNDVDLINSYGGDKAIPRVYLVDKTGKIIYDRQEAIDDTRLLKLKEILSDTFKN